MLSSESLQTSPTSIPVRTIYLDPPSICETISVIAPHLATLSVSNSTYVIIVHNPRAKSALIGASMFGGNQISNISRNVDDFILTRPYWVIHEEHYNSAVLIKINDENLYNILSTIAHVQYPPSCTDRFITIRSYSYGFHEYGNEYRNLQYSYHESMGSIFDVYLPTGNTSSYKGTAFLDPNYCPATINKWNCAFLPSTNCSWPSKVTECAGTDRSLCTPYGQAIYSQATLDGSKVTFQVLNGSPLREDLNKRTTSKYKMVQWKSVGDFTSLSRSIKDKPFDSGQVLPLAVLMRLNADFRHRVYQQISKFQRTTIPKFSANTDCVTVHIRHHDRNSETFDVSKFCREFVRHRNETCTNSTTGEVIHHCGMGIDFDYGCNTAIPFGAITFEQYIKAAEAVVGKGNPKNMFIITDDGKWVEREAKIYRREWNIYSLPAPPNHRLPSNFNGANIYASFKLAQQCSSFVGHSASAFALLIFEYMCNHHKVGGKSVFGKCPTMFDFRELALENLVLS